MLNKLFTKILGSRNERLVKKMAKAVAQINVLEPSMQGEVRVTVIATGFDKGAESMNDARGGMSQSGKGAPVIPFPNSKTRPSQGGMVPPSQRPSRPQVELGDMEIPTFIRRQMD